jgi:large subunit ribosomal protein L20
MARIKHAVSTHKRKKRLLKKAKGQFGQRSRRYQQARRSLMKGMSYAYRDRRTKKREIKNLWIIRINAACREEGIPYSRFMKGLSLANVAVDRKMLAEMAVHSPDAFSRLVQLAKEKIA